MSDDKEKVEMNILKKIMSTIRTESRELTDAVMGSYGTVKIEQEFDSAQSKLKKAKKALTEMMGRERKSSHILEIINDNIKKQETQIAEALKLGDKSDAMKHAFEVVDLEINRDFQIESISSIVSNIDYLQRQLELSERELKEFARKLTMIKTTQKVQKATKSIMGNIEGADANMLSAKKSLDRIREQQKKKNNRQEVEAQMLKDYSLDNSTRLTEIRNNKDSHNSAQNVINRIQDKS